MDIQSDRCSLDAVSQMADVIAVPGMHAPSPTCLDPARTYWRRAVVEPRPAMPASLLLDSHCLDHQA